MLSAAEEPGDRHDPGVCCSVMQDQHGQVASKPSEISLHECAHPAMIGLPTLAHPSSNDCKA